MSVSRIAKALSQGHTIETDSDGNSFLVSPNTVTETAPGPTCGTQVHVRLPIHPSHIAAMKAASQPVDGGA